jgi:hypothetical protein
VYVADLIPYLRQVMTVSLLTNLATCFCKWHMLYSDLYKNILQQHSAVTKRPLLKPVFFKLVCQVLKHCIYFTI